MCNFIKALLHHHRYHYLLSFTVKTITDKHQQTKNKFLCFGVAALPDFCLTKIEFCFSSWPQQITWQLTNFQTCWTRAGPAAPVTWLKSKVNLVPSFSISPWWKSLGTRLELSLSTAFYLKQNRIYRLHISDIGKFLNLNSKSVWSFEQSDSSLFILKSVGRREEE